MMTSVKLLLVFCILLLHQPELGEGKSSKARRRYNAHKFGKGLGELFMLVQRQPHLYGPVIGFLSIFTICGCFCCCTYMRRKKEVERRHTPDSYYENQADDLQLAEVNAEDSIKVKEDDYDNTVPVYPMSVDNTKPTYPSSVDNIAAPYPLSIDNAASPYPTFGNNTTLPYPPSVNNAGNGATANAVANVEVDINPSLPNASEARFAEINQFFNDGGSDNISNSDNITRANQVQDTTKENPTNPESFKQTFSYSGGGFSGIQSSGISIEPSDTSNQDTAYQLKPPEANAPFSYQPTDTMASYQYSSPSIFGSSQAANVETKESADTFSSPFTSPYPGAESTGSEGYQLPYPSTDAFPSIDPLLQPGSAFTYASDPYTADSQPTSPPASQEPPPYASSAGGWTSQSADHVARTIQKYPSVYEK